MNEFPPFDPRLADSIPAELRERRQWVVWSVEKRNGKATKVPRRAENGRLASTTDPATWGTFDEAVRAFKADGGLSGVGFVFSTGDLLVGVDLDKCRNPETGEIEPWAKEIIDGFRTYSEVSPSKTGVKMFTRGKLPFGGKRKGKIEVYQNGRYFTVTGMRIEGAPKTIGERQAELDKFVDAVFGGNTKGNRARPGKWKPVTPCELPTEKIEALTEKESLFGLTWNHERLDEPLWSTSEYDLALASFTAADGWSDEEIGALIVAFRKRHRLNPEKTERNDYLARTLRTARSGESKKRSIPGDNGSRVKDADPDEWELPIPLGQFSLPDFPQDVLPETLEPLSNYGEALSESLQVPRGLVYPLMLACGATALGRKIEVVVSQDHIEPVNLYVAAILPPGERKSAAITRVFAVVSEFEREENERLAPYLEEHANDKAILTARLQEARKEAAKTKSETERLNARERAKGISEQIRNLGEMYPLRLLSDDATPEAISRLLYQQAGRLAVVSSEGGIFQLIGGRYNQRIPNLDAILKAHAGDDIRVDRVSKDRPPEYTHKPALTMGLTIQPDVLHGLMTQPGFRGRGLLARFLYAIPSSKFGCRKLKPKPVPESVATAYRFLIRESLALEPRDGGSDGPKPHRIEVGGEATALLDEFKSHVESELGPGGDYESMRDWFGKWVGAVCRIAGVLHGLQFAASDRLTSTPIDGATMKAAIEIGGYFGQHAKAAYVEMGSDPAIEIARRIVASLAAKPAEQATKRDLWQRLKGGLNRADELDEPLKLLCDHGYLQELESKNMRSGRGADKRSQTFAVNPNIPNVSDSEGDQPC